MSRMGRLQREFGDDIKEIADEVLDELPLSRPQLRAAFTDSELEEINQLIEEVRAAQDENTKVAKLLNRGETALKLIRGLGVGV